ncbi:MULTISPECIES: M24 family metallopeptidase [Rhodobacterales]|jgi:creatinase|uniref:Creatinase n=2 Tax=Paracoccaceae TaxID=31989 RepID=A3V128_9RHOB|nr:MULTISPECIES: M24 family metallopeptidase [Paracoccaceae]EAQ08246.1 creatinase [Yoonia vestfoldensis SKA53]MDU9004617.1 M24 family metallopeptidase [Sedimentitalea todarodis]|tara:strand:- start:5063 stop:6277 length:1215 start_codon:yes stop_codon:yes gene_type:complete
MDDMLHVMEWHNGEKEFSPFSDNEMARRQNELRDWMGKNDVDASLFTSYHCINYYSGWLYCYFGRKYGMVIDQKNATTISAGIDGGQPFRRSFGNNITYTDWRRDNFYRAIQQLTPGAKRIGIEFDHVSLEYRQLLQDALPGVEFVDVGQPAMWMRTIKSAEEIKLIKEGARVADVGGAAVAAAVKAGVPEHEVAIASTNAMIREIANSFPFVELMDTWTWFQSGINTDGAHNPVTNKKVQSGEILSLNTFPMIFGYYTALERTLFCDHVDDASLDIWEKNVKVHERGLELIKPGARCMDIAIELNEMYREWDLLKYRSFGYGHSFGVLSHYYGREAGVELREDIETELKPGMVVSMEPMVMIPEGQPGAGGYREHDILVIGEDNTVENITGFPFGPEHNVIKN